MKLVFFSLLMIVSLSSHADRSCDDSLSFCKGDIVLSGNSIRTIETVDDSGRVILKGTPSYRQKYTTANAISKIVKYHDESCGVEWRGELCEGDIVLSGNSIRTIEALDNSGRVVLKGTSRYRQTYTTANAISKIVKCHRELCKGDIVLSGNSIRTIKALDNSGRVVLKGTSRYRQTYTTANAISKIVTIEALDNFSHADRSCDNKLSPCEEGDMVLYGNSIRTIEALDNSGRVILKGTSRYRQTYTTADAISKIVECHDDFCGEDIVLSGNSFDTIEALDNSSHADRSCDNKLSPCEEGDKVLFHNSIRTIKALDNSGRVVLKGTSRYRQTYTTADAISKIVECHGELCEGDIVLYGNSIRTIEALDNLGRVVLEGTVVYLRKYTTTDSVSLVR